MNFRRVLQKSWFTLRALKHWVNQKTIARRSARCAEKLAKQLKWNDFREPNCWLTIVISVTPDNIYSAAATIATIRSQRLHKIQLMVISAFEAANTLKSQFREHKNDFSPRCITTTSSSELTDILALAKGRYILVLNPGDRLTPDSLKVVGQELTQQHAPQILYSDVFKCRGSSRKATYFAKPAYDPVLQSQTDYMSGAVFLERSFLETAVLGGLAAPEKNVSNMLRLALCHADETRVLHLPFPVTIHASNETQIGHSSKFPKVNTGDAAKCASSSEKPPVSVIIPSRNQHALIARTLDGLLNKTDYEEIEVLVVDNGSNDNQVLDLYKRLEAENSNFKAFVEPAPFNFSAAVNKGLELASFGHVLLLNNDVEVCEPSWLSEMVACLDYKNVGIVGSRLLFPNDTLQHAGVTVGLNGMASHRFYKCPRDMVDPLGALQFRNSVSCVTAACMLISEACREAVGHWDEAHFAVAYNDVDYCLRARKAGYRCVFTPHATLYHHESSTRGKDRTSASKQRFEREKTALKQIHGTETYLDPAFSPWYARRPGPLQIACPKILPKSRSWWD